MSVDVANVATAVIGVIVTIIVIFQLVGSSSNDLILASGNISSSGLPIASLFSSSGVVLLIFMAGILIAVVRIALKMGK